MHSLFFTTLHHMSVEHVCSKCSSACSPGSLRPVDESLSHVAHLEDGRRLHVVPILACERIHDLLLGTFLATLGQALRERSPLAECPYTIKQASGSKRPRGTVFTLFFPTAMTPSRGEQREKGSPERGSCGSCRPSSRRFADGLQLPAKKTIETVLVSQD